MALSQKIVGLIIALIVISLSGLVILQVLLLNYTMDLKEQAFKRNVNASMALVAQKLRMHEVAGHAFFGTGHADSLYFTVKATIDTTQDSSDKPVEHNIITIMGEGFTDNPVEVTDRSILYNVSTPQQVRIEAYSFNDGMNCTITDTFLQTGLFRVDLDKPEYQTGKYLWKLNSDSATVMIQMEDGMPMGFFDESMVDSQRRLLEDVLNRIVVDDNELSGKGISAELIDSLILHSLLEYDLDLEYAFGIYNIHKDSLSFIKPAGYTKEVLASPYHTRLFPFALFSGGNEIRLYFPGQQAYLWRQAGSIFALTIVFMLIITGCFAYTIRTIIRQKKFSSLLVDFINNMTHEFKTPISTVKLACQAIMNPDILSGNTKIEQYGRMIQSENQRMSIQTEKILQMAVIEEGDYDLAISDVDIHETIKREVERETLHIENRHGKITLDLNARKYGVLADPVHLASIFANLLDNANKYSPEAPDITVSTRDLENRIEISVSDKGQGIKKSDAKMVFDKYYRVPSGDLHDVKGFGLGLSYVKLMTEAMAGDIWLESEPGKGSSVYISFPVSPTGEINDE